MLRKRLEVILIVTIVCVAVVSIKANEKESSSLIENTVGTAASPVSGKTVILDAGHGRSRWWRSW